MSGIVLSASVRQNLLSLQSTASLLATTQNDLATGNKVNSALDNPTNFFTSQALNNRASDIGNLLDSIGNGVQVLQAANTGITSLESLVQSAQSVATQALQTTIGYDTKSSFTAALGAGATASNLFGGTTISSASFVGVAVNSALTAPTAITGTTALTNAANSNSITATIVTGDTLTVDGHTITFKTGATPAAAAGTSGLVGNVLTDGNGNSTVYIGAGTTTDLLAAIDIATGAQTATINTTTGVAVLGTGTGAASTISGGAFHISTGTGSDLSITSSNATLLASLGIGSGTATTTFQRTQSSNSALALNSTLSIAAVGTGTATSITFGTGANQISNLNQLNTALAANNLQATVDANGNLTIQTDNDNASQTIGTVSSTSSLFNGKVSAAPVVDAAAQATRAGLVSQYNNILSQITTTAQELLVQRHQPVERRLAEAGVQRDRHLHAEHHRYDVQLGGPRPLQPGDRQRLHRQQRHQQGVDVAAERFQFAPRRSLDARFEPVGGADPSGLQQEPDQRAADRCLEPDAGRSEPGSGQQPGAVDPPVDRGLRARARQPVAAERASAAPLIEDQAKEDQTAGETPPFSFGQMDFGRGDESENTQENRLI